MRVEVRAAKMDDIEAMVALGKIGHARSALSKYEYDEGKSKLLAARLICTRRACVLVAEANGKIVGFLLGLAEDHFYAKMSYASDVVTYADTPGSGIRLLRAFEKWAFEERKVDQLMMGVTFGGDEADRTASLYRRLGFTAVGGIFTKNRGTPCPA